MVRDVAKSHAPDDSVRVMCLGPGPDKARDAARRLLTLGVTRLASFGLAGGLKMSLWPGTTLVARAVIGRDGTRHPTDPDWHARLIGLLIGDDEVIDGELVESAEPVMTVEDKSRLYKAFEAGAVDMESAAVAEEAARADLPFMAVRAIADPADRAIPRAATAALLDDGATAPARALRHALVHPMDLVGLVRLGLDSRAAYKTLRRVLTGTGALTGAPITVRIGMRR